MKTILAGIGFVVVLVALLLFAVCNDDDNDADSFGSVRLVFAAHQYDGGECWDEYDCRGRGYGDDDSYGNGRYDYDYGAHDRNRNRRRNRGAFSPGPFDRSPVTICLPYSCNSGGEQSGGNRNEQPPPDEEPMA